MLSAIAFATSLWGVAKGINWKVALPVIGGLALATFCYIKGYEDANSRCKSAEIAAQLREVKAEIAKANAAQIDAEDKANSLASTNETLNRKVNDYVNEVQKHIAKNGVCNLNAFDLRKLRNFNP